MKFSDLIKKKPADAPESPPPPVPVVKPAPAAPAAPPPSVFTQVQKRPTESTTVHPLPADEPDEVIEQRVAAHALKATEVYSEALGVLRDLFRNLQSPAPQSSWPVPKEVVFELIALLQSGNEELLALADRSTPDNYLYAHSLNVAILSLHLGLAMNLPKEELLTLGLGGLLHDLGMIRYEALALKAAKLTPEEMSLIRKHPSDGQSYLSVFPTLPADMKEQLFQIIGQSHERAGGGGYPSGLTTAQIHPLAKIVGLCDIYEALTHVRPWRNRMLPHDALKVLIDQYETEFDPGTVRTLIEALSLYPPGSFIRLSSGEMGRVIFTNRGLPTRPQVRLIMDGQNQRLSRPKIVNLATHPILFIAESVDETHVKSSDQRLMLELRAQRWWVKGL